MDIAAAIDGMKAEFQRHGVPTPTAVVFGNALFYHARKQLGMRARAWSPSERIMPDADVAIQYEGIVIVRSQHYD